MDSPGKPKDGENKDKKNRRMREEIPLVNYDWTFLNYHFGIRTLKVLNDN